MKQFTLLSQIMFVGHCTTGGSNKVWAACLALEQEDAADYPKGWFRRTLADHNCAMLRVSGIFTSLWHCSDIFGYSEKEKKGNLSFCHVPGFFIQ